MTQPRLSVSPLSEAPPPVPAPRRITPSIATSMAVAVVSQDRSTLPRVRAALRREGLAASVEDGGRTRLELDRLHRVPDVVVLATRDAERFTAEAHVIRRRLRDAHVVLILAPGTQQRARQLLDAGVDGVVLETEIESTLALAVRSASNGQLSVPRSLRYGVELPAFSHRERQILRLVAVGHTNEEIARRLYLSKSTVAGHLTGIFRRLGVRSRSEVVALILAADESARRSLLGIEAPGDDDPAGGR